MTVFPKKNSELHVVGQTVFLSSCHYCLLTDICFPCFILHEDDLYMRIITFLISLIQIFFS